MIVDHEVCSLLGADGRSGAAMPPRRGAPANRPMAPAGGDQGCPAERLRRVALGMPATVRWTKASRPRPRFASPKVWSWHVPDLRRRTAYGWKAALSFSSAIETAGRCAFCSLRHRTQHQLIIEKVSGRVRSDRVGP